MIIVEGPPPNARHPWSKRRDAMLGAFHLKGTTKVARQCAILALEVLLQGDTAGDVVRRHGDPALARQFAMRLRDELLPPSLSGLRRQRWLTCMRPLAELALLNNVYNLLDRTLVLFVARASGKQGPEIRVSYEGKGGLLGADDTPACEGMDQEENEAPLNQGPVTADGAPDWSAWNRSQQRTVDRFRRSDPGGPLTLACLILRLVSDLADYFLMIHSSGWALLQRSNYCKDGLYRTPGIEIIDNCPGIRTFKEGVEDAMRGGNVWAALDPRPFPAASVTRYEPSM